MPTMQEVRQKYPQYEDLSDEQLAGALHKKFYSDMPFDQFAAKVGLTAPKAEEPKPAQPVEQPVSTPVSTAQELYGMTPIGLPNRLGRMAGDFLINNGSDIASGMLDSAKQAISAPYRAYTGELQMTDESGRTSPQAIEEGFNMATWAPGGSVLGGAKQVAQKAVTSRVPSEGAQVAQAARNLGVTLPRAVTSDNAVVNQLGKTVANVPIVGQPLRKASETAVKQMDDAARGLQEGLGSGDRVFAGNQVRTGLHDFSKAMDAKIKGMEDDLAATMNPNVASPLPATRELVAKIQAERFKNANTGKSKALAEVEEALKRPGMTFEGLRGLRTKIRNLRDVNPDLLTTNDFEKAEFERLYGALTDDLKLAAENAGGKTARETFEKVASKEVQIAADRDALERVLGRNLSDEALSDRLFRMAGDKSSANLAALDKVKKSVSPETWSEVSSSVLNRIGRDAERNFTPDRFVTGWGHLSEGGKAILFDQTTRKSLNDLAKVSSRFKKLNQYANPSGTGQSVSTVFLGSAAYMDPVTVISGAIPAFATSKFLASPARVKAAADYAKAYEVAARMPGRSAQSILADKAKTLALVAANGNREMAANLASRLSTVQKAAADNQGDEQSRRPVGHPEPDKASDEFNSLYQQGRAF